jgi:hypothetical protein
MGAAQQGGRGVEEEPFNPAQGPAADLPRHEPEQGDEQEEEIDGRPAIAGLVSHAPD